MFSTSSIRISMSILLCAMSTSAITAAIISSQSLSQPQHVLPKRRRCVVMGVDIVEQGDGARRWSSKEICYVYESVEVYCKRTNDF